MCGIWLEYEYFLLFVLCGKKIHCRTAGAEDERNHRLVER